jgi:DNA-binding transcriptional LysR family regulator
MPRHDFVMAARPNHPLADRAGLRLADILSFPIACTPIVNEAVTTAVGGGGNSDLLEVDHDKLIPAIHVNSYDMARRIARDTDALVPGTVPMLSPELNARRLVRLDFDMPGLRTNYAIIHRKDRSLSPAAQTFIDLVRAVEAEVFATEIHAATPTHRRGRSKHQR